MEPQLPLIDVSDVEYRYPGSNTIFRELNFALYDNQHTVLIGASGSGKTTLLKLLAGLEKPISGQIHRRVSPIGGFVFQQPVLMDWLSVENNVVWPSNPRKVDNKKELHDLLYDVDLFDDRERYPRELSGGMKARVQLARALWYKPRIVFLDEAFSYLDERLKLNMHMLLKNLRDKYNFSAVIVSHLITEAIFLADRLLVILKCNDDGSSVVKEISEGLGFSNSGPESMLTKEFQEKVEETRKIMLLEEAA